MEQNSWVWADDLFLIYTFFLIFREENWGFLKDYDPKVRKYWKSYSLILELVLDFLYKFKIDESIIINEFENISISTNLLHLEAYPSQFCYCSLWQVENVAFVGKCDWKILIHLFPFFHG